jgi:hypothetical protein
MFNTQRLVSVNNALLPHTEQSLAARFLQHLSLGPASGLWLAHDTYDASRWCINVTSLRDDC